MTSLVFAALFFFAIHVGIAGSQLRDRLVSRLGEKGYLGFFSLLSIVGITWLCWAYSLAPTVWWATPAEWTRPVAWGLVFVAFLFVGVGAATPSPTAMGGDANWVSSVAELASAVRHSLTAPSTKASNSLAALNLTSALAG